MPLKKTLILTFAILYGLFSLLLFSDSLIIRLIETQKAYYLQRNENFKEITFTLQEWKKLENKKEFKIGNNYYDVKKIKVRNNKITTVVIMDEYENALKYISKNIFPKNIKHKTSKNKQIFPICILDSGWKPFFLFNKVATVNFFHSTTYFKLHSQTIYRPPCMS